MKNRNSGETIAETYYDSDDADLFYERVWGGEDIHIGISEPGLSIFDASRKTVVLMASTLNTLTKNSRVLDLGSGYGGSARYLAKTVGCHVTCLNLSEVQNQRNRLLNSEQGLEDLIDVLHGSFESIPSEANSYDIIWSQDAFLHSSKKQTVLEEIARVLKTDGELIFTDPMQADDCPADVLQPVFDRLNLDSMGSFTLYRQLSSALGFREVACNDLTNHLGTHYTRVCNELRQNYQALIKEISQAYLDNMIVGLDNWVEAERNKYLAWGILHFQKTA